MKPQRKTGIVKPSKDHQLWKLYQNLAAFTKQLNELPDAAAVKRQQPRSVPVGNLPLIF